MITDHLAFFHKLKREANASLFKNIKSIILEKFTNMLTKIIKIEYNEYNKTNNFLVIKSGFSVSSQKQINWFFCIQLKTVV